MKIQGGTIALPWTPPPLWEHIVCCIIYMYVSFIWFWNICGSLLYCCYFLLSWGSGANPWGPEKEDSFSKPTHYDGMLEVVGVTGVVHMGQIQSGLRSAIRIAQGGHVSNFLFFENLKVLINNIIITCKNCFQKWQKGGNIQGVSQTNLNFDNK